MDSPPAPSPAGGSTLVASIKRDVAEVKSIATDPSKLEFYLLWAGLGIGGLALGITAYDRTKGRGAGGRHGF